MPVEFQRNPYSIFDPRRYFAPEQRVNFSIGGSAPAAVAQNSPEVEDAMAQGVPVVRGERAPGNAPAAEIPIGRSADMPTELRRPDAARVAELNATAGGPSWDSLRDILGQQSRPPVPRIFNQGVEQHPLARVDDVPRQPSQAWDLYNASTLGSPAEVLARRNEIIGRHNLNRSLENEYYNMGRGMYSIPRAEQVSRTGLDPTQGLGTEGRTAGAHETTANAQQTEALTRAATAEFGMSSAAARQRFMERFPHATPAQLEQLVAGEEARGGFAPTTLRFMGGTAARGGLALPQIGGQQPSPSAVFPIQTATGPSTPSPTVGAPQSSLLERGVSTPTFASIADQAVPRSAAGRQEIGPGAFMMALARANPQIFATEANRAALRPYLESRFGRDAVEQASQGTRSLGPLSWSPASERMAQGGAIGAAGQLAANAPGGGLSSILSRIAGTTSPARAVIDTSGTQAALARIAGHPMPSWVAPTVTRAPAVAPGILSRLGSGLGRFAGAPLAILDGALALPAAGQMGRSLFGGMTPEQEGNAILEAALRRNQW